MKKLGCLLLAGLTLTGCTASNEWFLGKDNEPMPATLTPLSETTQLTVAWQVALGSNKTQFAQFAPAIEQGVIYAATASGHVRAIETATGQQRWATQLPPLATGVAVADGQLFVTSLAGDLIALNRIDGQPSWQTRLAAVAASLPAAHNGLVVVRTLSGVVQSFNTHDGALRWNYLTAKPSFSIYGTATPLFMQDAVAIPTDYGQIGVLTAAQGQVIWGQTLTRPQGKSQVKRMVDIDGELVLNQNILYAATFQGSLSALSARDGRVLWKKDVPSDSGVTVDPHYVYVADLQGNLIALNREDGSQHWKNSDLTGRRLTRPVVAGNHIIVGDFEGYLHVIDRNGQMRTRLRVSQAGLLTNMAIEANTLFVQDHQGRLTAVRLSAL